MRRLLVSAAVVSVLAACTPPAQRPEAPPDQPPAVVACNTVTPDAARQVAVEDAAAVAEAAAELRGGAIAPGVYDLVSAARIGTATGWSGTRAVALEVSESEAGVTFNWASAAPGGEVDRWTAAFTDTPQPRLSYSCGRMGEVGAEFATQPDRLELRLPDGGEGRLALTFQRRG